MIEYPKPIGSENTALFGAHLWECDGLIDEHRTYRLATVDADNTLPD